MILDVKPVVRLKGKLQLPASKSYSIRAFIIAACGGSSKIIGPSDCDDAVIALKTAKALGAIVKRQGHAWHVRANLKIFKNKIFDVGESGTVLRFLLPLLSVHAQSAVVKGKGTLVGRPNTHLLNTLRAQGMAIKGSGPKESVPVHYYGGKFKAGDIDIEGSLSSQFISALLIVCPRLQEDSRIRVIGNELVSQDYITMTQQILSKAGIGSKPIDARTYTVKGNQVFKGLKNFHVPSDWGLAAFWMAAGCLIESDIVLQGVLKEGMIQSDGHILKFLRQMGAKFVKTDTAIKVRGPFKLKGGEFSLKTCPDLVPIMTVLALFANGPTKLKDIRHARAKESDRLSDLRHELLKVGAGIRESADSLIIDPIAFYKPGQTLDPHQDHRLAMAFAILGLKIACKVKDMECSHKSYPGFVRDLKSFKTTKGI